MPAAKKSARKAGQPTKFSVGMLGHARLLAEHGFTDVKLAEFFGVAMSTISKWKVDQPKFSEALKAGKAISDAKVERSLFERATGYSHPDSHISVHQGVVTVTPTIKHYAPDTVACIFWLKNRKPAEWRDKVESSVEHTGNVTITIGGNV